MDIQNLVREKVIGNIKTGTKGANGLPQKLPYFNVEEDKATSSEMVDIFKQLYPDKPTRLRIRFTSEEPFNFKFKRYIKGKVVCIGNDSKAVTIGKDQKGNNAQITIECNEECEQRVCGKCKLVGSLKFVLDGIDAGGVWKLNTSGGFSLSNIATEIIKYKKAGMSIKGVPFELSLTPQESLAYGTYYSIDLKRTDIKPQLTIEESNIIESEQQETKQLIEGEKQTKKKNKNVNSDNKTETKEKIKTQENIEIEENETENIENKKIKEDYSNYLVVKKIMPTLIGGNKYDKIIFQDSNQQDVEYILHPEADQNIINYGEGTLIELLGSTMEMNYNILCKYNLIKAVDTWGNVIEFNNNEELKKAV